MSLDQFLKHAKASVINLDGEDRIDYSIESEHLAKAIAIIEDWRDSLRCMRLNMCDGAKDKICDQMWYQDVIEEAIEEAIAKAERIASG